MESEIVQIAADVKHVVIVFQGKRPENVGAAQRAIIFFQGRILPGRVVVHEGFDIGPVRKYIGIGIGAFILGRQRPSPVCKTIVIELTAQYPDKTITFEWTPELVLPKGTDDTVRWLATVLYDHFTIQLIVEIMDRIGFRTIMHGPFPLLSPVHELSLDHERMGDAEGIFGLLLVIDEIITPVFHPLPLAVDIIFIRALAGTGEILVINLHDLLCHFHHPGILHVVLGERGYGEAEQQDRYKSFHRHHVIGFYSGIVK